MRFPKLAEGPFFYLSVSTFDSAMRAILFEEIALPGMADSRPLSRKLRSECLVERGGTPRWAGQILIVVELPVPDTQ
jgi:hypothetical protein